MTKLKGKEFLDYLYENRLSRQSNDTIVANYFNNNKIDYCIVGGRAMIVHKVIRDTLDIDFLINKKDFNKVKKYLQDTGYKSMDEKYISFFNVETQHKVDIILSGSKYIDLFTFPTPNKVRKKINGVYFIDLKSLIIFKIYSGYSMERRMKDWNDVINLVEVNNLKSGYLNKEKDNKLKNVYELIIDNNISDLFTLKDY